MKKLLLIVALTCAMPLELLFLPSCQQAPSARVVQVQTLLAVGQSAESAVALSAQMYRDKKISAESARKVLDFYNLKFQPVYRTAVTAARSDLSSLASPDLMNLASELAAMVSTLMPVTPQ